MTTTDNGFGQVQQPTSVSVYRGFSGDLPDGCPPAGCADSEMTFYAAHRDSPPSEFDFTTAFERNAYRTDPECERKCNSVMRTIEDAQHLVSAVPRRYSRISRGRFLRTHGVWKHTPDQNYPSHHSLWLYAGIRMHNIFTETV